MRICDSCGQPLETGAVRYIAHIEVYAAYDPLEVTLDDLLRDHTREIEQIYEQCAGLTEEELMREVYVEFTYDLCPACQKRYIRDPLRSCRAV